MKKAVIAGLIAAGAAFGFGLSQTVGGTTAATPQQSTPSHSSDDFLFVQEPSPDAEEGDQEDGRDRRNCPDKDGDGEPDEPSDTNDVVDQV